MLETKDCILLVDDEQAVINAVRRALMDEGYEIFTAQGGKEALEILATHPIKVIVCDERMPKMTGAELLSIVSMRHPETARIMLTGYATLEAAMKAVNEGEICRFFSKPWNDVELRLGIRSAIEKYDQDVKVRKLMSEVRTQQLKRDEVAQDSSKTQAWGKGRDGSFQMPELTDQEILQILAACQTEVKK